MAVITDVDLSILENQEQEIYDNFINSLKSPVTKQIYGINIKYTERYNQGYSHGCSDAKKGGHQYLNSHPTHTPIFMNGYQQGYAACSSSHAPSPSTTVSVNRNNMFSDQNMCKAVQTYLMLSCSAYVKSNGVLTAKGQVAKNCITNGIILTGGGYLLSHGTIAALGTGPIINILKPLSEATGCGGIVNWQKLSQDSDGAVAFLGLLGIH